MNFLTKKCSFPISTPRKPLDLEATFRPRLRRRNCATAWVRWRLGGNRTERQIETIFHRKTTGRCGSQWVDLRGKLQETIVFPMKYRICLYFFP